MREAKLFHKAYDPINIKDEKDDYLANLKHDHTTFGNFDPRPLDIPRYPHMNSQQNPIDSKSPRDNYSNFTRNTDCYGKNNLLQD